MEYTFSITLTIQKLMQWYSLSPEDAEKLLHEIENGEDALIDAVIEQLDYWHNKLFFKR